MQIERELIPESTLEEFADEHGLIMEVHERSASRWIGAESRFYAHFKHCEVKDGPMLCGAFGDGATEDAAIRKYTSEISEKLLVFNAGADDRREIKAPRFIPSPQPPLPPSTVQG